jgi:hypothetical protein
MKQRLDRRNAPQGAASRACARSRLRCRSGRVPARAVTLAARAGVQSMGEASGQASLSPGAPGREANPVVSA